MAKLAPQDSLESVARLLDIVPFLSTHQGIALSELAAAFGVSMDQMTKDLTTLWMCGLPGYTPYELIDLSFDSGFVTISNAQTLEKPRALNRDEILALLLGLESLREDLKGSDSEVVEQINATISRLTHLIGEAVSKSVQAGAPSSSATLAICEKTIAGRGALEIDYHSVSRDEVSHRTIFPLEITTDGKHSYLYAHCTSSEGYRTFRIDRIVTCVVNPEIEATLSGVNVAAANSTLEAAIKISSRKRDIAENFQPLNSSPEIGDEFIVRCFSSDWAVREVMSFGGSAQVTHPESLRKQIFARASQALSAYGS